MQGRAGIEGVARRGGARRRLALVLGVLPTLLGAGSTLPPPPVLPLADRVVPQEEWAQRLVETLGLDAGQRHDPVSGESAPPLADLLCPAHAGPAGAAPEPVPVSVLSAGPPLRGRAEVKYGTLYVLVVEGEGPQRWSVGPHAAGTLDPTRLHVDVAPRLLPLAAGWQDVEADLPAGARATRATLVPYTPLCVGPRDGWQGERDLDFGSKARTLVQALGLEANLPVDGEGFGVEGEAFVRASPAALVTDEAVGAPASAGRWVIAAGGSPAELAYRLEVPRDGVYSVIARTHGGDRQLWSVAGGPLLPVHPEARADGFAWTLVSTQALPAGTISLRAVLADGDGLDAVRLVRRRAGDDDYLGVLASFGLAEGPAGAPVTDAAAQSNLASAVLQLGAAGFVGRLGPPPGWDLTGTEARLRHLYTRPLSPFLPADL